jgi:hypothetical protein
MTARRVGGAFAAVMCLLALSVPPAAAAPDKKRPAPVPVANDALTRSLENGRLSEAKYALERARSLFRLRAVRSRFGDVVRPDPHAATLILRDLALRLGELSASERRAARGILSRPDDNTYPDEHHYPAGATVLTACDSGARYCIHWIEEAPDAPDPTDDNGNDIPDQVDRTAAVLDEAWTMEFDTLGYRAPLPDDDSQGQAGSPELDVYLAELGADGIFGYVTSDDPDTANTDGPWDVSAYLVLDNDYSEFCAIACDLATATMFLQVTTAHELKHTSQYAYDWTEDSWLLESDATATEDVVFDDANDNRRYLNTSPLTRPSVSVDNSNPEAQYQYGSWIFLRYLSERLGQGVLKTIWERADGSAGAPDDYSLEAVRNAVGRSLFTSEFALFARWNRTPDRDGYYEEGDAYPSTPTVATYTLRPSAPTTGWQSRKIRHLANAYYSFRPAQSVSAIARLKVTVDLPDLPKRPAATLLVFRKSGGYSVKPISLNSSGNGAKTVAFGRGTVSRVDLVLTNASARFKLSSCWTYTTDYSCGGAVARDENRTYLFTAKLR